MSNQKIEQILYVYYRDIVYSEAVQEAFGLIFVINLEAIGKRELYYRDYYQYKVAGAVDKTISVSADSPIIKDIDKINGTTLGFIDDAPHHITTCPRTGCARDNVVSYF